MLLAALLAGHTGCTSAGGSPPDADVRTPDAGRPRVERAPTPAEPAAPPAWPAAGSRLVAPAIAFPAGFGRHRIYLDAGHGTRGNPGNTSSLCIDEQVYTLRVARDLAERLRATGHFETLVSRTGQNGPTYRERLTRATAWDAAALISLHSDVRGIEDAETWSPRPGGRCRRNQDHPGFAILYSRRRGDAALVRRRLALARNLARHMTAAGFQPYDGRDYDTAYTADAEVPGVFLDNQSLYFLCRPAMPSVIVETHHAWDSREERRWSDGTAWPAFGAAVIGALTDLLQANTTLDGG